MALLHALHRLASNSGLYPSVIQHQPVKTTGAHAPQIGEGSFGQVFTVKHEGRLLALKVSRPNLEAKVIAITHVKDIDISDPATDILQGSHHLVQSQPRQRSAILRGLLQSSRGSIHASVAVHGQRQR